MIMNHYGNIGHGNIYLILEQMMMNHYGNIGHGNIYLILEQMN